MDDEGQVLGLERDFASLEGANRDKFELHLRNILNQIFGVALVATKLEIRFHTVEDKDISQIDVSPFAQPVLVRFADKNGQIQERFYVRSGNASQELSKAKMLAYLKEKTSQNTL